MKPVREWGECRRAEEARQGCKLCKLCKNPLLQIVHLCFRRNLALARPYRELWSVDLATEIVLPKGEGAECYTITSASISDPQGGMWPPKYFKVMWMSQIILLLGANTWRVGYTDQVKESRWHTKISQFLWIFSISWRKPMYSVSVRPIIKPSGIWE